MRRAPVAAVLAACLASPVLVAALWAQAIPPPPPPPPVVRDPILIQPGRGGGPGQPVTRTVPVGTASIEGTITSADTGRPLKGVRVTISGAVPSAGRAATAAAAAAPAAAGAPGARGAAVPSVMFGPGGFPPPAATLAGGLGQAGVSRTVMTDAQGQFSVARLPAGRFTISANRNGYLNTTYGQKRPGTGRGTPVQLTDGQQAKIAMPLIKGGVITGTVIGEDGEPQPNAQVRLWRYATESGIKRLQNSNGGQTDDRGVYRLHGLQPGDYIVSATPNTSDLGMERVAAEMAALEQAIASGTLRAPAMPGAAPTVSVTIQPPDQEQQGPMGYVPTYHPNTPVPSESPVIHISGGDERSNVDVQVQQVRSSSIQGQIAAALAPGLAVQVSLQNDDLTAPSNGNSARANPDGKFTFGNISPGRYTLLAYTVRAPIQQMQNGMVVSSVSSVMPLGGPNQLEDSQKLWGRATVNVEGQQPVVGVSITLQPSRTIAGQVLFDMNTPPNPGQFRLTVSLNNAPYSPSIASPTPVPIGPDGRFSIGGVLPGKYILRAGGGTVRSSIVNGQDTLDVPLDFTGDRDITDAVITVTDKISELSGTLTDATGKPAFDYSVIAVSADQRYWTPGSRRISIAQLSLDGTYTFRNLPAGDYMVAAVSDLEPGGQYDPELLRSLGGASLRVSISEGGKVSQNLRVAAGR